MRKFFIEVLSCVSRLLNVLRGGTADMTLSAQAYLYEEAALQAVIDWLFLKLFGEENHCEKWALHEVRRSRATVDIFEARQ